MYTADDILSSGSKYPERPRDFPPDSRTKANALLLASRVTRLITEFVNKTGHAAPKISSGYRPAATNIAVGGAAKSNHLVAAAVDFLDTDEQLDGFCLTNQSLLSMLGLWLEHPESTPGWCHVQCVPPKSGARVFRVK